MHFRSLEVRDMNHVRSGLKNLLKKSMFQKDRGQKHSSHTVGTLFKTNEVVNERDTQVQRDFPPIPSGFIF